MKPTEKSLKLNWQSIKNAYNAFKNASFYNKRCLTYIENNIMKTNDHSSPTITNVLPHMPHPSLSFAEVKRKF